MATRQRPFNGTISPANARRLLKAYENALNGLHVAEHALIDPDVADTR